MKYPKYLAEGGRIGFIAPSFGCSFSPYAEKFDSALKKLSELGYINVLGSNVRKSDGIGKSTKAVDCGAEINEFFLSDNCDVIMSCGGGETMCEDLAFVDFDKIKETGGKWYMGYSDNTNLTFLLPLLCDIAAIYGPSAPAFGMRDWHPSINDALELLKGRKRSFANYDGWEAESLVTEDNPLEPFNITMPYKQLVVGAEMDPDRLKNMHDSGKTGESAVQGKNVPAENTVAVAEGEISGRKTGASAGVSFSGRLMGGCLDCLVTLCGTKFDKVKEFNGRYKEDGVIWFLESCDLNPFGIRRAIWQLKNAGWFDNAKGFLIGRPGHIGENMWGLTCDAAAISMLRELELPIVLNVDIGHISPRIPIVSGGLAEVDAVDNSLNIRYLEG